MTIRKAKARNIDNRRLLSLQIGEVFMPKLGMHVAWEAHGERAALMLMDRQRGLMGIVSQPERMRIVVNGKTVTYTPDFEVLLDALPSEICEVKGHSQLQEEKVLTKLAAAELEVARSGRVFRVFNSRELTSSMELRNVQLLRRYARYPVTPEQSDSVLSFFRLSDKVPLGQLIDAAEQHGISREQVYALLYRGELTHDWNQLVCNASLIGPGVSNANP